MERFDPPPTTHRGTEASRELSHLSAVESATDVVVLTDEGVREAGVVDDVTRTLSGATVLDGVESNPSVDTVRSVAARVRDADVVVGVGGGSVMDAAKVASTLPAFGSFETLRSAAHDDDPSRLAANVPLVLVPTTAGTGSETGHWAVVSDHDRAEKLSVGHPAMRAAAVVLDPALTVSVPPYLTAATGADVVTHAVEALTASGANALTDPYAESAFDVAVSTLERAVADGSDLDARERMLDASYLAGVAMNNAGLGAVHAVSHAVGGLYDTPHGHTNALLLPHVVRENARQSSTARSVYGRLVDAPPEDAGEELAARLTALFEAVDLDRSLPGAPAAWDVEAVADRAVDNLNMETNPAQFDRETVTEVCRRAFDDS